MPPQAPYKMPEVCLGETVLWQHNFADQTPVAAVVTRVGSNAISVSIFPPDNKGCIPKDGVRHASDPGLDRIISNSGIWRHTDIGARLRAVEVLMESMAGDGK